MDEIHLLTSMAIRRKLVIAPYIKDIYDIFDDGQRGRLCKMMADRKAELNGLTMKSRMHALFIMGYKNSYNKYLASDLYRAIRTVVFEEKGSHCIACLEKATQLHHRRYTLIELLGLDTSNLDPVCHQCHSSSEVKITDGLKVRSSLLQANRNLDNIIRNNGYMYQRLSQLVHTGN